MNKRPNILWLLSDQHRPDVSGFAGDNVVDTKNLDRLAQRSVWARNATCASPLCTPSRMTILTGKEVHNCSAWNNHWILFPEHLTWPKHFANHGYRTCLVGKMHFGGKNQMNGFQYRPYGDLRHGLGHQPEPLSKYPAYDNWQSAGITEIPESMLQDAVVARESLAFLLEHQAETPERPWFLCASFGRPHSPLTTPGRYFKRYKGKVPPEKIGGEHSSKLEEFASKMFRGLSRKEIDLGRQGYYACVDFLDDCIGELLDGLEKADMLENTIIIYTSDHGEMLGQFGCWSKTQYYQPSLGVPLLISGPGIPHGKELDHPVSLIDLYPTMCSMAGIPTPEGLDGIDFSPALRFPENAPQAREYAASSYYKHGIRVHFSRIPDDEPRAAWRCVCDKRWKYVEIEQGKTLLFDMLKDPLETNNLAGNPEFTDLKLKMRNWLYNDFSWETAHERLRNDWKRLPEFLSGHFPGSPNQYMLPDGRIFDSEKSLYDVRWLPIPSFTGGIIPQQFG